jgi:hypothetical protein
MLALMTAVVSLLREEHRCRVFENRLLRRILGHREMKLQADGVSDHVKEDERSRADSTCGT